MTSSDKEPMKAIQVKFPVSKKNEIKSFAAARGLTIHQLVLDMFDAYKRHEEQKEKS